MAAPQRVSNMIAATRFYIDKIVSDPALGGMKVLLLDATTTKIVSMVYSQTQVLEKEVYLVEQLGKPHEAMAHFKAAVFVQPTEANCAILERELRDPKFAEYHLFFSNIVPHDMLTRLGRADVHDVVRQVQEYYADFLSINEDFFHLAAENSISLSSPSSRSLETGALFDRNVNGVLSVLLALKRRPSQIRYQVSSDLARRVASEIDMAIERDDVFVFPRHEGPILLILDRRDDPVTPLLTQWTYQAMVHELKGLNNNRVVLRGAPGISPDLEEVVLSTTQDPFFARNKFSNFGDLGIAVNQMMQEYQRNAKINDTSNIKSIADMQSFMERYPAFRAQSINVSKHVAVLGELSRIVDKCHLLEISQLEQEIACSNERAAQKRELMEKIMSPGIQPPDKLRLAILYLIKYETYINDIKDIKSALSSPPNRFPPGDLRLLDAIISYAGEDKRAQGLFSGGGLLSTLTKGLQDLGKLEGAQNVYTQHQPLMSKFLEDFSKGKIKDATYPNISSSASTSKPSEVIIFVVGGATYEEATKVAEFNKQNPNLRITLGGSTVLNSRNFLKEIMKNFAR